jgi:hypothetical protein
MGDMFNGATAFDQDLSCWDVEHIASAPTGFATGAAFELTTAKHPRWNAPPACMVLVFDTTLQAGTGTVSLNLGGTVDALVRWGDGSSNSYTTSGH